MLPYSVTEVYGIRNSGKYGDLKQTYNEMYQIYGDVNPNTIVCPKTVITEDSGAGFTLLVEKTKDTYLAYAKNTLNKAYLGEKIKCEILEQMERISLNK